MARIVVVGAGYAGLHAVRHARTDGVDVVLIDVEASHAFLPRFAAVAAGRAAPGDAAAPADELLELPVMVDRVVALDVAGRVARLGSGRRLSYDALVLAVGAEPAAPPVPGLDEHGYRLASVASVLQLRERLVDHHRPDERLIVVGGGPTGVQLAAEVAHQHALPVTLVEQAERLLPGEPRSMGRAARRILRAAGVELHLGVGVARVGPGGAWLADGTVLDGPVVWAGGWRAQGSQLLPGAPTRDGRLVTEPDLAVPGAPGVFAAGDVAAHLDVLGRPLAMSAQIAARAGAVAGANAAAYVRGRRTRSARLVELGRVLDLGGGRGVARIGPLPLTRRPLDRLVPALHLAIDLRHLLQVAGVRGVWEHAPGRGVLEDAPGRGVLEDAAGRGVWGHAPGGGVLELDGSAKRA